ncbi:MAG: hypothetical protein ACHQ49_09245 [Elusimicrobiota bacterium]
MRAIALLALLAVPVRAGISLGWAPAIDAALDGVRGPGREVVRGFDGAILGGLQVRLNEIHALARAGANDLASLRRLRGKTASVAGVPPEHLAALERSLQILSPVVARLEARGLKPDERAAAAEDLAAPLSDALAEEARQANDRAKFLASHYGDEKIPLAQALADSEEADALLRDGYPFLTTGTLDRLARVYDSHRTPKLAKRAQADAEALALAAADDGDMRDAVAQPPRSLLQRIRAFLGLAP